MSTATAITALIPPLTVRQVLDAATRLADLLDEHGVTYSYVTASGDTSTEYIAVHTNRASAAKGPAAIAATLGLVVEHTEFGPAMSRYACVKTSFEGVSVNLFGADLNEFAPEEDPRPVAPTFSAVDVTGWTPDEIADDRAEADEIEQLYRDDLAAWLIRHPEAPDAQECGAVDEDDQGKRVCHTDRSHRSLGIDCRFVPVQS